MYSDEEDNGRRNGYFVEHQVKNPKEGRSPGKMNHLTEKLLNNLPIPMLENEKLRRKTYFPA